MLSLEIEYKFICIGCRKNHIGTVDAWGATLQQRSTTPITLLSASSPYVHKHTQLFKALVHLLPQWALIPSSSNIVKLAGTRNSVFEALLSQLSNSSVEDASACCIDTGRCTQCTSTCNLILTHLFFLICGFLHNFVLNKIYQTWCKNLKSHLRLQIGWKH